MDDPELDDPELDDPEFDDPELDDPLFGVDPLPAVPPPGKFPHGDPLGVVPGVVEAFGFTVEGCALLPDDGGLVEFAPGTFDGGADPVGGGVFELVGGAV